MEMDLFGLAERETERRMKTGKREKDKKRDGESPKETTKVGAVKGRGVEKGGGA